MKYELKYDRNDRVRVRCGMGAFDFGKARGLEVLLSNDENVLSVVAADANGSITIEYVSGARNSIIEKLDSLDLSEIKPSTELSMKVLDNKVFFDIIKQTIFRGVSKYLLPTPISTIYTLYKAWQFIKEGLKELRQFRLNVAVLDAAAVSSAILMRQFSTAGSIMYMLSISEIFENYTKRKAKITLAKSIAINVDKVWLVSEGSEKEVPLSSVKKGDMIRVRTGCMVPVDGEICSGMADVNQSTLTGEALAIPREEGDTVFAGTTVENGDIIIRTDKLPSDARVSKIVDLIENSNDLKANIQTKAEHVANKIVPFNFLGAGLVLLFTRNITKAAAVLMVDYSCGLKITTSISVISAMKQATTEGMMVKGGKHLETLSEVDTVVFDKTGTLTKATPVLERIISLTDKYTEDELLKVAACIEEHFPHSVARAIVKAAMDRGIEHREEHTEVNYIVAHGISTTLYGEKVVIGSKHFILEDEQSDVSDEAKEIIAGISTTNSAVYLAIGGKLVGIFLVEDPPREEAREVIESLRKSGIKKVIMLTGDSENAAKAVAEKIGVDEYRSQVLPDDKNRIIKELQDAGSTVMMVGDGINDSPALAAADVSVAMRDGSDIAREVADITLPGDLYQLVTVKNMGNALIKKINKNHMAIIGCNSLFMLGGITNVIGLNTAAFLHNASTMAISVDSMKQLDIKEKS